MGVSRRPLKAFSLLELVVSLVVLGVVALIVIASFDTLIGQSEVEAAEASALAFDSEYRKMVAYDSSQSSAVRVAAMLSDGSGAWDGYVDDSLASAGVVEVTTGSVCVRLVLATTSGQSADGRLDVCGGPVPVTGPMTLTVNTALSAGSTVALPLRGAASLTVDWGSPAANTACQTSVSGVQAADILCTYATPGVYTVSLTGSLDRFGSDVAWLHVEKLVSVGSFGGLGLTSLAGAFRGAVNLSDVPDVLPATVTDLTRTFSGATSFNDASVSNWDVSAVTSLNGTFHTASAFNRDLSMWDTSSVTSLEATFRNTLVFNGNVSTWDTSSVTTMLNTFRDAPEFNRPIGSWNVANVTTLERAFFNATSFNQPIGSWNTSQVTNLASTFSGATAFNQSLTGWDTSSVTRIDYLFERASSFNGDVSTWDVGNVSNMSLVFHDAPVFNQNISGWDTSAATSMYFMFNGASAFNQNIAVWDTSLVTNMSRMFYNATSFNQDLSGWCVGAVTSNANFASGATSWTLPQPVWGTCPP